MISQNIANHLKPFNLNKDDEILAVNALRCLSAALPEGANSGHPGAPLGCSAILYALYMHHMRFSIKNPCWINRDRFVLSNGHACALLYSMMHFLGNLSLSDIKGFRRLNTKCPGHPERDPEIGIEVTTGPLGQGIAQAVGLAIASAQLAEKYNQPGNEHVFDNYVYCLLGDGCLQEGISYEACSLAAHLKLSNLIVLFDNNNITIDGFTELSTSECIAGRFKATNWHVLHVKNADTDFTAVSLAIKEAKKNKCQPTIIICDTVIGIGSKHAGTEKVHGSPLGLDEILRLRRELKIAVKPEESKEDIYTIADKVYQLFRQRVEYCEENYYIPWKKYFENDYKKHYLAEYNEIVNRINKTLTSTDIINKLSNCQLETKSMSTRQLSGKMLNIIAAELPELLGGSADLTVSTCVKVNQWEPFCHSNFLGNFIHFGIREHGMMGICNGISAFGMHRVFNSCFLNFITYGWGAVRISALSHLPVLYICTHDSIELGEDGPTHQAIEAASLCRATPNLIYFRPADETEVIAGYISWLSQTTTPYVMALCRSGVPNLRQTTIAAALRGAYIIQEFLEDDEEPQSYDASSNITNVINEGLRKIGLKHSHKPKCIIGSCGSELSICLAAYKGLIEKYNVRIVSIPSWCLFRNQSDMYQFEIIPRQYKSLYVEAANSLGYEKWFTDAIQMTTFGLSANKKDVQEHFGFTPQNIINKVHEMMESS